VLGGRISTVEALYTVLGGIVSVLVTVHRAGQSSIYFHLLNSAVDTVVFVINLNEIL